MSRGRSTRMNDLEAVLRRAVRPATPAQPGDASTVAPVAAAPGATATAVLEPPAPAGAAVGTMPVATPVPGMADPVGTMAQESQALWLDPELIDPNPDQPRLYINPEHREALRQSILANGMDDPIVIDNEGTLLRPRWVLRSGNTRREIALELKRDGHPIQVLCIARPYIADPHVRRRERLKEALRENHVRTAMHPLDLAIALARLRDEFGMPAEQLQTEYGFRDHTVTSRWINVGRAGRLMTPAEVQAIHEAKVPITQTDLFELLSVADKNDLRRDERRKQAFLSLVHRQEGAAEDARQLANQHRSARGTRRRATTPTTPRALVVRRAKQGTVLTLALPRQFPREPRARAAQAEALVDGAAVLLGETWDRMSAELSQPELTRILAPDGAGRDGHIGTFLLRVAEQLQAQGKGIQVSDALARALLTSRDERPVPHKLQTTQ